MGNKVNKTAIIRARNLTRLARGLFESVVSEEDSARLEKYRLIALQLKWLMDEVEEDNIVHPDLGLQLLLFIEHKEDNTDGVPTMRHLALEVLKDSERELAKYE